MIRNRAWNNSKRGQVVTKLVCCFQVWGFCSKSRNFLRDNPVCKGGVSPSCVFDFPLYHQPYVQILQLHAKNLGFLTFLFAWFHVSVCHPHTWPMKRKHAAFHTKWWFMWLSSFNDIIGHMKRDNSKRDKLLQKMARLLQVGVFHYKIGLVASFESYSL
jgi:hypothetical protein